MTPPFVIYFIIFFFVIFFAIIIISIVLEKKRSEALEQSAKSMGFSYTKKPAENELGSIGNLNLFMQGHSRKIFNMIRGSRNSFPLSVFDYKYTVGGGKHSHTYKQTVALIALTTALPKFYLGPEYFISRLGDLFGFKDIDFDNYPAFSDNYLLKGDNEPQIRALFKPEIITFFESQKKGIILEAQGNNLIFYRLNRRIKPAEINSFIDEVLKFSSLFEKEDF